MQVAHIKYLLADEIPEVDRVSDDDNIIRIHGINSPTIRQHHDLYRQLMYGRGPLTRIQREMIAVVVSAANECHY
jgi:alkylhydroperoxidase family enzyme